MFKEEDFQYAMENTRVVIEPQSAIETFGTTTFRFLLVSEMMDQVDVVRVRDGRIEAERPKILSPQFFSKMLLEGFGEEARGYADWVEQNSSMHRILRYGFQFRKTDLEENILHEPMESVMGRLTERVREWKDPMSTLIEGVDEAWEVCLLKFTTDLIHRSADGNMQEWKKRGLI